MNDANKQLVTLYEVAGLTPEEIALDQQLPLETVLFALKQSSAVFRKQEKTQDVSKEEQDEMLNILKRIAATQEYENPRVAVAAAKYVFEEGKGRNGRKNVPQGINIMIFNDNAQKARNRAAALRAKAGIKDVESKLIEETVDK
jgi:uncharacterized membrane-anchored protein